MKQRRWRRGTGVGIGLLVGCLALWITYEIGIGSSNGFAVIIGLAVLGELIVWFYNRRMRHKPVEPKSGD